MQASYFGKSEAPLFGVHYPPAKGQKRVGVLLCYPGPEEYMRVHWAYRNLVQQLGRHGFHVFKFDYYGTGDSAGAMGAGDLARWRRDAVTALEELRDLSGVSRLALVGTRLGGAIAATLGEELLRAERPLTIDAMVLWDPVVSGVAYLGELSALQDRRILNSRNPLEQHVNENCPELLGYPLSRQMEQSLRALDLRGQGKSAAMTPARRTIVVGSEELTQYSDLAKRFGEGVETGFVHVGEACFWRVQELLEQAILPSRIVQAVADQLARTCP